MDNDKKRWVTKIHAGFLMAGVAITALPYLIVPYLPWQLNLTASVPLGFYRKTYGEVKNGALVSFCLPKEIARYAKERGYVHFGFSCPGWTQALLKPVVATTGDVVRLSAWGVVVDGHLPFANSTVYATDLEGRPHQRWIPLGTNLIPEGYVFVLSTAHPRSWDSRYFGFISTTAIQTTMEEAWIW